MELIKYILLGIMQGITEPLPISSSGHLYILKLLLNTNTFNDLNFEIFLNFSSFIAILIIFFGDVVELVNGFFEYIFKKNRKYKIEFNYCIRIIIGSIPVGILGFFLKDKIESLLSNNIILVGGSFILTGILLLIVMNYRGNKTDKDITIKDAIIIGIIQAVSLIPGISRSGSTLVGCLLCGLDRKTSLKYTFMLYFPVSVASMILGVSDVLSGYLTSNMLITYIIGMIFSGIFTFISYKWLSSIVQKGKLWFFSIYLFIVGIFTIVYFI